MAHVHLLHLLRIDCRYAEVRALWEATGRWDATRPWGRGRFGGCRLLREWRSPVAGSGRVCGHLRRVSGGRVRRSTRELLPAGRRECLIDRTSNLLVGRGRGASVGLGVGILLRENRCRRSGGLSLVEIYQF